MINARSETVSEKPSFRSAFRARRCLVPADGFFEWRREGSRKQPYLFALLRGGPFAIAAIWERWSDGDLASIESCALLTTAANALVGEYHDRMPVLLAPQDFDLWLDPSVSSVDQLGALFEPFAADAMSVYPVSTRVNSPANDDPGVIERVEGLSGDVGAAGST